VQNKQTTLPKFFGLFCYQTSLKQNIRFVIMNNLLPSRLEYGLRFDLKGSTKGRCASDREKRKAHPCYKDLDIMKMLPGGLRLDEDVYDRLKATLERDVSCRHPWWPSAGLAKAGLCSAHS
jgi:1-phosphatidylinositol-4-phosphate 5-kinase